MKAYLTRRYRFSASHRLHCDAMSAEENQAVYGKCNNPHGHGHNYALEITVAGPVNRKTGMVCDLSDLDAFVKNHILERLDYQNLNTLAEFQTTVPTTENVCVALYNLMEKGFRYAKVERIRIEETLFNSFEYAGGREIRE